MKPEEKQIIRLFAKTPAGLSDGMYWGRMAIISRPKSTINFDTNSSQIGAQISLTINQLIPVVFKKGNPSTDITIEKLNFKEDSAGVTMSLIAKTDNTTPFIGTGKLTVKDEKGAVVQELKVPLSIYYRLLKEVKLNCKYMATGKYQYSFDIISGRDDVKDEFLVKAEEKHIENSFYFDKSKYLTTTK